jgi:hypothetical protein
MNPIDIHKLESKVNTKMIRLCKQSKCYEQGKVAHRHPDYPFSNTGLMLLVGKMGSGMTNDMLKHLLIANHLGPKRARFIQRLFIGAV